MADNHEAQRGASRGALTSGGVHFCSSSTAGTAQISVRLALQCEFQAGCEDCCCRGCFRILSCPVGCSSAQGRAGRGSCPELCAWMGAAMPRIIHLSGAVLWVWGFMANFQVWVDTSRGTSQTTLFLDLKIYLLIGKLVLFFQSPNVLPMPICYGRMSIGTGSVTFFCPPRLPVFPKFVLICLGAFLPFPGGHFVFPLAFFSCFFCCYRWPSATF